MLENPDKLREMASGAGVHSTDLMSPESAEHLCAKCDHYAKNWTPDSGKALERSEIDRQKIQIYLY